YFSNISSNLDFSRRLFTRRASSTSKSCECGRADSGEMLVRGRLFGGSILATGLLEMWQCERRTEGRKRIQLSIPVCCLISRHGNLIALPLVTNNSDNAGKKNTPFSASNDPEIFPLATPQLPADSRTGRSKKMPET